MSYVLFDFETLTDGQNVTTGNTGASLVNAVGSIKGSSAAAGHGSMGLSFASTGFCICRFSLPGSSTSVAFCGAFTRLASGQDSTALRLRRAGGGYHVFQIRLGAGQLFIGETATGVTPALGVTYWTAFTADVATGSGDWTVYSASGSQVATGTATFTTNATNVAEVDVGAFDAGHTYGWDALQFNVGSLAPIAPLVAPPDPATGTAATGWAATASATGTAPPVPLATGTAATGWQATATATGTAPAVPVSTGTAATSWAAVSSATGAAPAVGQATGTASTPWAAVASATGTAPAVPDATGVALISWAATASATGTAPPIGQASGTAATLWTATATAAGTAPAIPDATGVALAPWVAAATATGTTPPVGQASGVAAASWLAAASATGQAPGIPMATGIALAAWAAVATAIGSAGGSTPPPEFTSPGATLTGNLATAMLAANAAGAKLTTNPAGATLHATTHDAQWRYPDMSKWKTGDTWPPLEMTLTDGGTPVDLTTATSVAFHAAPKAPATIAINAPMQVADATTGVVRYLWQPGDLDEVGTFRAEAEVTWGDGSIQTFPPAAYLSYDVAAQLDETVTP